MSTARTQFFKSSQNCSTYFRPIIGEEIKEGVVGSTSYFITSFESKENTDIPKNSKGIFQLFSAGLLLRIFKNNQSISLAIPFQEITQLVLSKGVEKVKPIVFSPMWILLKLGVKLEIARNFRIFVHEYSIEPTTLSLKTETFQLELQTNGYTFRSQHHFFAKLKEIRNLKVN